MGFPHDTVGVFINGGTQNDEMDCLFHGKSFYKWMI